MKPFSRGAAGAAVEGGVGPWRSPSCDERALVPLQWTRWLDCNKFDKKDFDYFQGIPG
jgi:hypothetical protein